MPLILAIEPDKRQAAHITSMARHRLHAESRWPCRLSARSPHSATASPTDPETPALLPPQDDAALSERLRQLDERAAHVQTPTIPLLAAPGRSSPARGMLAALRRERPGSSADGCDPAVFAEQITAYLERAAIERQEHHRTHDEEPIAAATIKTDATDPLDSFASEPAVEPVPSFEPEPAFDPEPAFEPAPAHVEAVRVVAHVHSREPLQRRTVGYRQRAGTRGLYHRGGQPARDGCSRGRRFRLNSRRRER